MSTERYNASLSEKKWQAAWEDQQAFRAETMVERFTARMHVEVLQNEVLLSFGRPGCASTK